MKRIILTGWFFLFIITLYGQVTLAKTYSYSTSIVKLETLGYKYYLMDVPNSQCRIYNMDHSIFKTINCNVPNGYYLADIKFVSENLFNTDSQIELAYTYYKYVSTSSSYYYMYGARIVNENESILQTIDGAQYIYVNKTGDAEYKLLAYCFDYSVSPEKVWTNIYNLPGTLVSVLNISGKQPDSFLNAYPNPATDLIRLEYQLPEKIKSASLFLADSNGRAVKSFQIDGHSDHLALNVNDLSTGVYLYYIEYGNSRTLSKKIIIK
ncbi:MAG: T9SS type A sorting domain-containing protein [Bacteroidota bacterium]|nr:T9SS type A sorting domain-containing protein [Bacteroidota bacterium]